MYRAASGLARESHVPTCALPSRRAAFTGFVRISSIVPFDVVAPIWPSTPTPFSRNMGEGANALSFLMCSGRGGAAIYLLPSLFCGEGGWGDEGVTVSAANSVASQTAGLQTAAGRLPCQISMTFWAEIRLMAPAASIALKALCGVRTQRGARRSGWSTGSGSLLNTSRAAPANLVRFQRGD